MATGKGTAALHLEPDRIDLLVLQATPFCNLDCDYCYLPNRQVGRRMSRETLTAAFGSVLGSSFVGARLGVAWHAGEPLVLPRSYYREAFAIAEAANHRGVTLRHSFQTNGVLVDVAWVEFALRHGARIGVSLDGPRHIHDAHRRSRRGRGSFDGALRAVRLLADAGVDFHVITVLTVATLAIPDELYDFYLASGVRRVGFNVEEIENANASSSLAAPGAQEAFGHFLRRFIERVEADGRALELRELAAAEAALLSARPGAAVDNPLARPLRIVTVDVDGAIGTFSPELMGARSPTHADFVFGNVHDKRPLDAILSAPALQRTRAEIALGVRHCAARCAYFSVCGGGAPSNKFFETGSLAATETLFCRLARQGVADAVLESLERRFAPAAVGAC